MPDDEDEDDDCDDWVGHDLMYTIPWRDARERASKSFCF